MTFKITFLGATERVTGSQYLIRTDSHTVLLECGLVQGSREDEALNRQAFPVPPEQIDAVVLSHAHIDHSGRRSILPGADQQRTQPAVTGRNTLGKTPN
jgi:metallo-beta-lactamase family protein